MNFEGLFDGSFGGDMPYNNNTTANRPANNSSGLALGLQSNMEGHGDLSAWALHASGGSTSGGGGDADSAGKNKEDENESRSGSDNLDAVSGDDLDQQDNPRKKKRYHRHTPQQIQELEALFKECPHPDEKQRLELSKRLNLDGRQVKFWFQNRRTQMKTQLERHENLILRQENEKLRIENITIRDSMRNPMCNNCGGPALLGDVSLEEQHLRIENARLKDELDRVCALAGKFLGRPVTTLSSQIAQSSLPSSMLELGVGSNGYNAIGSIAPTMNHTPDFLQGMSSSQLVPMSAPMALNVSGMTGNERMYVEMAIAAMEELVNLVHMEDNMWIPSSNDGMQTLNYDEYSRMFRRVIGMSPMGYVPEATKETGMVFINSLALVETLMDAGRWAEMFPCLIARTTTTDIINTGVAGTINGTLQLMQAEIEVLSPLVPVRVVRFLRFAKQHGDGIWGVVDVSIDALAENHSTAAAPFTNCRRLPSGFMVQDMSDGYSKVTWVEHAEYEESSVHRLYRQLLRSGKAFGARRWIATLQRQCECLAILNSSAMVTRDETATITPNGRLSMLKLAQRMTENFCAGVCPSSTHEWTKLTVENIGEDVRVMTRKSMNDPGEPAGVVLSAATSVWMPVAPQRLFDFLRDGKLRGEWDILSNGGPMREMAHIAKGRNNVNAVSLLRATQAVNNKQNNMLILQETYTDISGSLVVYAPVDVPAMHIVMSGGDSSYVALLPSGFAILPDDTVVPSDNGGSTTSSLLTVAFQILVNSQPTAKLTVESVETVNNLISCTIEKIKAALHIETEAAAA